MTQPLKTVSPLVTELNPNAYKAGPIHQVVRIEIDLMLDAVPGAWHGPEDFIAWVQHHNYVLHAEHTGNVVGTVTETKVDQTKAKATAFDNLQDALGYFGNGTDTTVSISQDDATREWVVVVGNNVKHRFINKNLSEALAQAADFAQDR